jgi:hypothetical protein
MFEKWKPYVSAITGKKTWPDRTMLVFIIGGFVGGCIVLGFASAALGISPDELMAFFAGFIAGVGTMIWYQGSR